MRKDAEGPASGGSGRSLVRAGALSLRRWGWDGDRWTDSGDAEEDRTLPNSFSLILTDRQNMGIISETEAQRVKGHVINEQKHTWDLKGRCLSRKPLLALSGTPSRSFCLENLIIL